MEQKRIDELDESFLGEEFIDEEDVHTKFEPQETKKSPKPKKAKKTVAKKAAQSLAVSKEVSPEEVVITPAQAEPAEMARPPVDPWGDDKEEGFLQDVSTWKAITGIAVILLLLSIFTQGFNFSESAAGIPLSEAESKAVNYVNTKLLRPPFTAEVIKAEEVNDLYKITLSVAGEEVDSYLTKDGNLFFPQGFSLDDTSLAAGSQETLPADELQEPEVIEPTPAEPAVAPPSVPEIVATSTLHFKKWVFTPGKITVNKGDVVKITLLPDTSNPTQKLEEFTFAVPQFGVEKEVTGTTEVVFTADKSGSFEFTCSSCEDWRGMKGTLVVK